MVLYTFECDKCGNTEKIENPVNLKFSCRLENCNGVMRCRSIFPFYYKRGKVTKNEGKLINPDNELTSLMSLLFPKKKFKKSLLNEKLFEYKVVMCPHCGKIQVTRGQEMFKCRNCNKVSQYRKKGQWNVKLYDFPKFEEALIFAKKWIEEVNFYYTLDTKL